RLYEAPPANQSSLNFGESFDLVVSPIPNRNYAANETFRVTSWWRSQQPVELDYSYGLFLRGTDQQIIAQMDGSLATTEGPTSQWEARADYAPLALSLTLPPGLPAGEYDLLLGVYYWEDGVRLELS